MKIKYGITFLLAITLFTATASASDYIIEDSNGNPLFVVNESGEKQIYNGNLYMNGNSITDQSGPLTLGGGSVEVPNGVLDLKNNNLVNARLIDLSDRDGDGENYRIIESPTDGDFRIENQGTGEDIIRASDTGSVEIVNGNLKMNGNEIQDVGGLRLGWANLTDYPTGCGSEEAVQVIGDTLSCTSLNPGGTVETGGGAKGQVAYFIDSENITGSDNFYWNNSEVELGIGTNTPTAALDINGRTNLRNALLMNGNDISNPGLVDGIHIDSPGNAIGVDGSNQYYIPTGAIRSSELDSNSVTASGGELDSSVAGNFLNLNSGSLDVQDNWVDESGDTMSGALSLGGNNLNNPNTINFADNNGDGITFNIGEAGGGADNLELRSSEGVDIFDMRSDGTVYMNGPLKLGGNNLDNPNLVDGVDIDNPGNGIIIDGSNRYAVDSDSVGSGELKENSVTNTELANSDNFDMNGLTVTGDAQVQGDLDVWGNITNTDVENLNINGSLLPPSGYSDTFDVGSSSRRWRVGYFQDLTLGDNSIVNSELTNSDITVNANNGLVGGGTASLGGSTGLSHADTSGQSNIDNSGGTIIQDLNFDGYGHVTGANSYNLDNRYYTETESDSNFVDISGDSGLGRMSFSENGENIALNDPDFGSSYFALKTAGSSSNTNQNFYWLAINDNGGSTQYIKTIQFGIDGDVSLPSGNLKLSSGNLNMNSNSITNFFGSNCQSDEVVESVNADGTYNCVSITGTADDTYVNEAGDSMTGNLDMQGNDIQNVGTMNASTIQENGNDIGGIYVDESGDSMSGSLNMQGNHIDNANFIDLNSVGDIRVDGGDAIRLDNNQNVDIPNGNLEVGSNSNRESSGKLGIEDTGSQRYHFDIVDESQTAKLRTWAKAYNTPSNSYNAFNLRIQGNADAGGIMNASRIRSIAYPTSNSGSLILESTESGVLKQGLRIDQNQDIYLPNGGLDVSGQLSVGSTQCNVGSYIDGDGSCTDVVSETSGEYVNEAGDTMTGNLNMNYNKIDNLGELNVSTSTDQIAHFSDTGVTLSQPLSVESSGPLSVSNGIDLTGSSSNTIESYSTMYLQTSSGSPSDIVLDPTGDVGIDANTSITGNLDMQDSAITNVDWANSDQGSGSGLNADTLDGVELANINWGDVAMAQSDISVADLGNADSNLNMNGYNLQNVDHLDMDSTADIRTDGTDAVRLDGNQNVAIPNGDLGIGTQPSVGQVHVNDPNGGDGSSPGIFVQDPTAGENYGAKFVYNDDGANELGLMVRDGGTDTVGLGINRNNANVRIPNGGLDISGQLSVGSTQCNNGQYIDGDGTCTDVVSETSGEYVNEAGDTMTGTLDMNSNPIVNVGSNNIDIGDGQGNIAMNGQRIVDGGLTQVSGIGVTDSLSTAETEVSGNSVYVQGDVSVDGDFVGAGADVAENINNESEMSSGTVVQISGNMSVDKTDEKRDTTVAGVVSRDPAMVMAKERDGVPIAMSGTVPVKFSDENGGVKPGDMLTTASKEGHAMKCDDIVECQGSIIGKAMQPQSETGEVKMLISRG